VKAKQAFVSKKIRIGRGYIQAFLTPLQAKNLILLRGSKGYIMCGYLNLGAAERFKDAAAKISKVSTISQALNSRVMSLTSRARNLGIYKGQPVKEALKIIA